MVSLAVERDNQALTSYEMFCSFFLITSFLAVHLSFSSDNNLSCCAVLNVIHLFIRLYICIFICLHASNLVSTWLSCLYLPYCINLVSMCVKYNLSTECTMLRPLTHLFTEPFTGTVDQGC